MQSFPETKQTKGLLKKQAF